MSAQHYDDQPASAADFTQARPFVLQDIGPDGQPQAMLVTPATETIVDRDIARSLISDLLLVLTSGAAAALLFAASVIDALGDSVSTMT